MPALAGLDATLSMALTLRRLSDGAALLSPTDVAPAQPSRAEVARFTLHGLDGAPLASTEAVADLGALRATLGAIRRGAPASPRMPRWSRSPRESRRWPRRLAVLDRAVTEVIADLNAA